MSIQRVFMPTIKHMDLIKKALESYRYRRGPNQATVEEIEGLIKLVEDYLTDLREQVAKEMIELDLFVKELKLERKMKGINNENE